MQLNIVIPVHNQVECLRQCLDSIRKTAPRCLDVVVDVIDNGSSENVLDALLTLTQHCGSVTGRYSRLDTNAGVTVPWNLGLHRAMDSGADIICICNSDVVFGEEVLLNCSAMCHCFGAAFPLSIQGGPLPTGFQELARMAARGEACSTAVTDALLGEARPRNLARLRALFTQKHREPDVDTGGFAGWCFFLGRQTVERIGYFDEQFTLWYQDSDYHNRLRASGVVPMEIRTSLIHHYESRTILSMPRQFECHGWRKQDEARFFTKYPKEQR